MRPYVNYTVVHDNPPDYLNYLQTGTDLGNSKVINLIDTETKSLIKNNTRLIDDEFRLNPLFSAQFIEILRSKYNLSSILKTMKTLGVLQAYIPDFSNVVGQMQFDLFHVYTVDELSLIHI